MNCLLDDNDRPEILRYLGYRSEKMKNTCEDDISKGIELANSVSVIRWVWRLFNIRKIDAGISLCGVNVVLPGKDIYKHMADAGEAVMFAVTLGLDFDIEVDKLMITDAALGVIVNSCGIALLEKAADYVQLEMDRNIPTGLKTGIRFSPGYGDLPLESQKDFIRILDTERKIGVRLNSNLLMKPMKSITAIAPLY